MALFRQVPKEEIVYAELKHIQEQKAFVPPQPTTQVVYAALSFDNRPGN